MTTAAPRRDVPATLDELSERTHEAWGAYHESTRELKGRDYDEAEDSAWELLQDELRTLADRRLELEAEAATAGR
jgi:hypothetical protein